MARKRNGQKVAPAKGPSGRKSKARSTSLDASDRSFEARNRALHAIARMRREGVSLSDAARAEGVSRKTLFKYVRAALRKTRTGAWVATKSDKYVRHLWLPGPRGMVLVRARGSEEAKLASAYLAALTRWAKTEKPYELAFFHGKRNGGYELLTAARALRALREAGLLHLALRCTPGCGRMKNVHPLRTARREAKRKAAPRNGVVSFVLRSSTPPGATTTLL